MIYKANQICSSYSSMYIEFEYIQKPALENGYPRSFIQNQVRKTLNRHLERSKTKKEKLTRSKETENIDKKKGQILIDLPFIGNETKTLDKKIINLEKTVGPDLHVQPIPRRPPTIETFLP